MNKISYYICDEMKKLREGLTARHIPWQDYSEKGISTCDFWMCRTWFEYKDCRWSVIHGYGSYGGIASFNNQDEQKLECMCSLINGGEPEGYLTADDIFKLMEEKDA